MWYVTNLSTTAVLEDTPSTVRVVRRDTGGTVIVGLTFRYWHLHQLVSGHGVHKVVSFTESKLFNVSGTDLGVGEHGNILVTF